MEELFSGSATIGATEFSLPNNSTTLTPRTDKGLFEWKLDLGALIAGDRYIIRVREKTLSSSSQALVAAFVVGEGIMADPEFTLPALALMHGWDVSVQKAVGVDRVVEWSGRLVGDVREEFGEVASIGVDEFSLPNDSTSLTLRTEKGVYQLWVSAVNVAGGDNFLLRKRVKVRAGSTERVVALHNFIEVQPLPNHVLPATSLAHGWNYTLQKVAGTDRMFSWSIRRLG